MIGLERRRLDRLAADGSSFLALSARQEHGVFLNRGEVGLEASVKGSV